MFGDERLELLKNSFSLLGVETGSHLARMLQSLSLIHTKYEGSEVFSFPFHEPGDHKFLLILNLHFQPALRSRRFIGASPILGEDSLNAHSLDGFENRVRIRGEMLGIAHDIVPFDALLQ